DGRPPERYRGGCGSPPAHCQEAEEAAPAKHYLVLSVHLLLVHRDVFPRRLEIGISGCRRVISTGRHPCRIIRSASFCADRNQPIPSMRNMPKEPAIELSGIATIGSVLRRF